MSGLVRVSERIGSKLLSGREKLANISGSALRLQYHLRHRQHHHHKRPEQDALKRCRMILRWKPSTERISSRDSEHQHRHRWLRWALQ